MLRWFSFNYHFLQDYDDAVVHSTRPNVLLVPLSLMQAALPIAASVT